MSKSGMKKPPLGRGLGALLKPALPGQNQAIQKPQESEPHPPAASRGTDQRAAADIQGSPSKKPALTQTPPSKKTTSKTASKTAGKTAGKTSGKTPRKTAGKTSEQMAASNKDRPLSGHPSPNPNLTADSTISPPSNPSITELSLPLEDQVFHVKLSQVKPNPNQPRQQFKPEALEELALSIRQNGILQPLLVTPLALSTETSPSTEESLSTEANPATPLYEIIAGERRWRAASLAGLKTIPVLIRKPTETQKLEQALIENIQRQDLNPIEEARALSRLNTHLGLTQEELAQRLGKSRSAIANTLRLLKLPAQIQDQLIHEELSMGHARALLALPTEADQLDLAQLILQKDYSVRETEQAVQNRLHSMDTNPPQPDAADRPSSPQQGSTIPSAYRLAIETIEASLMQKIGLKVQLKDRNDRGKLVISYANADEREQLLQHLGLESN